MTIEEVAAMYKNGDITVQGAVWWIITGVNPDINKADIARAIDCTISSIDLCLNKLEKAGRISRVTTSIPGKQRFHVTYLPIK